MPSPDGSVSVGIGLPTRPTAWFELRQSALTRRWYSACSVEPDASSTDTSSLPGPHPPHRKHASTIAALAFAPFLTALPFPRREYGEPMARRFWIALTLITLVVVFSASGTSGGASAPLGDRVDGDTARGRGAFASALASVDRPRHLALRVRSRPSIAIRVGYALDCHGDGRQHTVERHRTIHGSGAIRSIAPTVKAPRYCNFGATAQLRNARRGRLTLTLFARGE